MRHRRQRITLPVHVGLDAGCDPQDSPVTREVSLADDQFRDADPCRDPAALRDV